MGVDAPRIGRRHRFLKALAATVIVLVTLAIVLAAVGYWSVTRSFPQTSGTIGIPGLRHTVTVYRDDAGIPQITASNADDLFEAQGYVHAQDRFWEMDFRRHVTAGRLSAMFGASQVGTDTLIRTLGWRDVAKQEVAAMDKTTRGYYQAYADGVNAYLKTHKGGSISLEYSVLGLQNHDYSPAPWTVVDSVSWLKAMAWDLRANLVSEVDRALLNTTLGADQIADLYPPYPYGKHPTITPLGGGSDTATTATGAAKTGAGGGPKQTQKPDAAGTPETTAAAVAANSAAPLAQLRGELAAVPQLLGPAGPGIGSNSWVVSGAHTATGKPLLANDPHLGASEPSVWYQMGLHCRTVGPACPFDVAGFSFSGMPGIIIGHNAHIAWGFTNAPADVTDLFLEKVTGDTYEYNGQKLPLATRKETISVAGGPDVHITVRSTRHGPLVTGTTSNFAAIADYDGADPGALAPTTTDAAGPTPVYELALEWTALTPGTTASAVFTLDAATNWNGFRAAAAQFDVPSQNLLYADTDGNIGYQMPGKVAIRASGDGSMPVAGWTSAHDWTGYVPFDQLPSELNPAKGFIVTANNAIVGPSYPVWLTSDWDHGYRANEITARLATQIAAGTKLTARDMSRLQADNVDQNADVLVPILTSLKLTGDAKRGVDVLRGWDHRDDADSAAAAYFNIFFENLLQYAFARKMPDAAPPTGGDRWFAVVARLAAQPASPWWSDEDLGLSGRDDMFSYVAKKSYQEAVQLMGGDPKNWRWGSIHTLELTNASLGTSGIGPIEALFNRGPYEVDGSSSVVDATSWNASEGYSVTTLPSMRQVIDLGDFDKSTWINLTGESGHAFHPNYVDQTTLWQQHRTRPWPFTPAAVRAAAKDTLTLTPR